MYENKNYESLIGTKGFSDNLLKTHFTLYQGYVANTNKLSDTLKKMLESGNTTTPEFAELKRRFGWEFNGMRLHELYFDNMIKDGKAIDKNSELHKKIIEQFGSFDNFTKDFKETGKMRGIGWVIMYYDTQSGRIINTWIGEHDAGHLTGATPLLVMDVFEHAFFPDYGTKRADYIDAFFASINWAEVEKRFI